MRSRHLATLIVIASAAFSVARAAPPAPDNKFKLKNGANGAVCLECHSGDFETALKKPFVHTPVKSRNCIGCHNPHASAHGKMLADDPGKTCAACHSVVPQKPKSTHKPVADGGCLSCHDPHASKFKFNLVKSAGDLCAGCHKPISDAAARATFKHRPVEQGCATCHDPHGSGQSTKLLKGGVPELCVG